MGEDFDLLASLVVASVLIPTSMPTSALALLERLNIGFNQDADKIAFARVPADRQIEDFSVIRKRTAPYNVERLGLLGQYDSAVSKGESIGGVASRLAMAARFKFRILRSLLEEIRESRIEITQRLLKNN